ncbi:hypothetical protein GCM10010912_68780 [Paenibacillus albidus]|uniref:Uncharacterized protein n=1 Tax=Paenibacillus albidus TaxID=2041023 RepID=A0A917LDA8_9BACL|nr:hypothetical protein GCM10010912_68780 [Paenibacillus albidus]
MPGHTDYVGVVNAGTLTEIGWVKIKELKRLKGLTKHKGLSRRTRLIKIENL